MPQGDQFSIMRIEDQPETKRVEMPLFRCNFFRVVFFTNPGVSFQLGEERLESSTNSVYFSYPGKLESWRTRQKIHGYLVCFTREFLQTEGNETALSRQFPYFNFEAAPILQLQSPEAEQLKGHLHAMIHEIGSAHPDRFEMIRLSLMQYLIALRRLYHISNQQLTDSVRNSHKILHSFRKALDHHFEQLALGEAAVTPSVSLMAEKVFLNASYLNTTIKNLTGKSASSHIKEKTLLEIKSYLLHTDLQMAEVSHRLGFTNVSYFNRFFKQATGLTPSAFKQGK